MTTVPIPAWTADSILPPVNAASPVSPERSPYVVSLTDYVLRFSDTAERRVVLDGLLRYRAALHAAGIVQGFQWLDGSFLEHVELTEGRAPNDIDVVSFYRLPVSATQVQLGALSNPANAKATFRVDAYLVHLGMPPERLTRQGAYWYSVWSHRRNQVWMGFVEVDLAPAEDALAAATLVSVTNAGAGP